MSECMISAPMKQAGRRLPRRKDLFACRYLQGSAGSGRLNGGSAGIEAGLPAGSTIMFSERLIQNRQFLKS
ncbi:hypothetical protein [Paraburkholderia sp. J94]|uniref:hypothetical protein n=1 Tax=Paraburkholderia sp. J94 TaxID=2805441 RepID=UPI002AB2A8E8|nr:hypothetical protein [Paraburkholderia sp. J94]